MIHEQWISVKNCYPSEDRRVLIFEDGRMEIAYILCWESEGPDWIYSGDDDAIYHRNPSHWMPLPQPPKYNEMDKC